MLQVLIGRSNRYTVVEQAQWAMDGGAAWLVLQCRDFEDVEIRKFADRLLPLCRECGVILTFEGNDAMARELGVHGVLLDAAADALEARKTLGPEAIIGVRSDDAEHVVALAKADIDYVAMSLRNPSLELLRMHDAGCRVPVVAYGDFKPEDVDELRYNGYDGICTGRYIYEADNPSACVRSFLKKR